MLLSNPILDISDIIQIISIIITTFISIASIIIAVATLRQTNKITKESARAYIVFYIKKERAQSDYSLIIKNYGQSGGKLISIDIDPPLSYDKSCYAIDRKVITDHKNIFLAPGQSLKSVFSFRQYPDTFFNVKVTYETLGEIYTDTYSINLDYTDSILQSEPTIRDTAEALKQINKSIREVSDKLD
ncbi:hypothetical protein [Turicibacter sanguinis]|uniref:hypothetical protein n=1 Tax=Turicibacter sanguinis TaxID=154288 RepID=UPI0012BC7301|nr:hypothetical protein [Turicibacter sanguinis]MDB8564562.1 hypothetical protein [Turicibacter sanguinis]MDB8575746.1 hypothetical protein [Turicibacter sanguinis]MDB8579483.1 hypothetical protein [Turicibacter sanguinis]MDB8584258.1 hypothetical protein [Turicibacter sanguinis]MDB8587167.1 hypothetical protein [Turicibacter sanguinis]